MAVSESAWSAPEPVSRASGSDPPAVQPSEPGILNPIRAHSRFDYRRHVPDPRLIAYVENFWTITWDLRGQEPYTATVLPYPSVNLSVTNEEADVTGLVRNRYERRLVGRGYVVGARFRPGCFRPFLGSSVSSLTDTHRPIAEVLGRSSDELELAVAGTDDLAARVSLLTDFLLAEPPERDPVAESIAGLVEEIAARPEITRVAQVAVLAEMTIRQLERLFGDYVGAGPKWAIIRCRLQDAAARAAGSTPPNWADLASELGFTDQAHLTRVFSRMIGSPPAAYAAQLRTVE